MHTDSIPGKFRLLRKALIVPSTDFWSGLITNGAFVAKPSEFDILMASRALLMISIEGDSGLWLGAGSFLMEFVKPIDARS